MTQFDLPLPALREYRPEVNAPDDLRDFWNATLAGSRAQATAPVWERVDTGLRLVETYDLTFSGYGGHPVKAWVHLPAGTTGPLPTVVEYQGYGGGRKQPWQDHTYAEAGYVHVFMDSRGQGTWSAGATPDPTPDAGSSTVAGMMTRGIESPETYYYRRLITDAVLAVDAARQLPWVDPERIALTGISQGGGLTIASAALSDGIVAALPDVPFLCDYARAMAITDRPPYSEIVTYLGRYRDREEQVMSTLAYFDCVALAPFATARTHFSVALRDMTCPPSTVFAAYNAWGGAEREITVYPHNEHEGGGEMHMAARLRTLADVFA